MPDPTAEATVTWWQDRIAQVFDGRPERLIPALQYVQREAGYLPPQAITAVARHLRIPEAKVFGVATFYSLFHLKPRGRNQITVCRGTACHVRGSSRLLADIEKLLGIKAGNTTEDRSFSLDTVACLGSCALAPVVVKDKVYGRQNSASVKRLVEDAPSSSASHGKSRVESADPSETKTAKRRNVKKTNARVTN